MGSAVIHAHPFSNTIISFVIGAAQTSERQKITSLKVDFLSWQKSLAYSLRIFVDNFSLLSPLQRDSLLGSKFSTEGGFPVMAETTRKLAASTP